ncbi:hypothetical protein Malapachy_2378 [Malassezia pachydermatis]|uniref:Succinate dehydrogenase assembly factor 4, mitochondrial n=1 Tax=Malassezia pachydermatis TaxID=77020 RepID=A0A0M8MXV2_9BASI|nr:hypothetical protein Malapachy_2378 [Malassezia pachydermatis]KOS15751.1 hypothetical protein Malapachy_2378 [Malassezia pachydermatis]
MLLLRNVLRPGLFLRRSFSTGSTTCTEFPFDRPSPMRLPKEDQEEFERLVRENENKTPFVSEDEDGNVINLHPDARQAPAADFKGDTNPETGEVGGPKSDPLRWKSEWSFGGRATDF